MPEFSLPHDHGAHGHTEDLYRELKNVEHFGAVCDIFKQLSDPTRVRIFWLLSHREECVINIAALLDMSSPAVSHHLRSLAQSGLIESRRCGKEVYYKAGDTMQIKLLHEIVEQVMQIACPEKAVDYQDSQEQIIRHAAAITSVPRITLMRSAITTTILVESRYRLAISLFSYPRILVMEIAFSFFSMISFVRR